MKIQILCTKDLRDLRSNSKDLSWRFSFFESCINSIDYSLCEMAVLGELISQVGEPEDGTASD